MEAGEMWREELFFACVRTERVGVSERRGRGRGRE